MSYIRVAVPVPLYREFDYRVPTNIASSKLEIGLRVKVPFGARKLIGVITEINITSNFSPHKIKDAFELLDESPCLDLDIINLCKWLSTYYQVPLGEALQLGVPKALRKQRSIVVAKKFIFYSLLDETQAKTTLSRAPKQLKIWQFIHTNQNGVSNNQLSQEFKSWQTIIKSLLEKGLVKKQSPPSISNQSKSPPKTLNPEQKLALEKIETNKFNVNLLYGITGSGKTEVYLQLIDKIIKKGQQAMVLIPEISLSPQTLSRFQKRFSVNVVAQHSKMADGKRYQSWLQTRSGEAKILIATRSGIFNQFKNLGLIIVDEEHDSSFKQQDGTRYSARDLAVLRTKNLNIPLVLGSATPSLESLHNAWNKNYRLLKLKTRANNAQSPRFIIEDLTLQKSGEIFTANTLNKIKQTIDQQLQVLVFINRRGFAPVLYCNSCGKINQCPSCDAHMILHKNPKRLICHHCSNNAEVSGNCNNCGSNQLLLLGHGTEKVEQYLQEIFTDTHIIRVDRDSTSKRKSWDDLYQNITQDKACIMVGTQMLAKGHHFPSVALVVVLDADQGLLNTDFRASEHLSQLITQVAGRAGRDKHKGEVILQTTQPNNRVLKILLQKGYYELSKILLEERKQACFPPVTAMIVIRCESHHANLAQDFLNTVSQLINFKQIEKLGPLPAPMEKRAGKYRYQIVLQAENKKIMQVFLAQFMPKIVKLKTQNKIRWNIDVDPINLF